MAINFLSSIQNINNLRLRKKLFNLIKQQSDDDYSIIDKIYLYVQDQNKAKYQNLIEKHKNSGLTQLEDPKALIEYSNNMQRMFIKILKSTSQKENVKY